MNELTKEQYDDLPDYAKSAFAESEGKFIPVKDAKLKQTLDDLDRKNKELNGKLSELAAGQQAAIEQAREQALAEALKKGNGEEAERLREEKRQDELRRAREEARAEAQKEFKVQIARKQAQSELIEIISELGPKSDVAKRNLAALLERRQSVDEDGNITYLNDDGSASSLDKKGFLADVDKSGLYDDLRAPKSANVGGGNVNGSSGGSAPTGRKFNEMNGAELSKLRQQNPTEYARLRDEYYNNEA